MSKFLHLCVQKVVEAVLEEEVEEDGGNVGLCHRLVHRGVVRRQQRRDQPFSHPVKLSPRMIFQNRGQSPGNGKPGLAKRRVKETTSCHHSRTGGWVG